MGFRFDVGNYLIAVIRRLHPPWGVAGQPASSSTYCSGTQFRSRNAIILRSTTSSTQESASEQPVQDSGPSLWKIELKQRKSVTDSTVTDYGAARYPAIAMASGSPPMRVEPKRRPARLRQLRRRAANPCRFWPPCVCAIRRGARRVGRPGSLIGAGSIPASPLEADPTKPLLSSESH